LREDNPPNANAARLYRNIGGVNGADVDPLVVAWHFKFTGAERSSGARTRFELAHFNGAGFNTGPRGEGTAGITLFNQISGRLFDEYNLVLRVTDNVALRDELIANGWISAAGFLHFPSGVLKEPGVWHKMEIEVRDTVINFFIDGVLRNPTPYETGVPRPNATAYDFVIIGEGFSNNGPLMMYDNVAVTQGAAFPFGDPVTPAPTIAGPLFPDGALVSVSDIDPNATDITVFSNGVQIGSATGAFPGGTADIAVSPNLVNGAAINATQIVAGLESCPSIPVSVAVTPVTIADAVLVPGQTSIQISNLEEGLASNISVFSNDSTIVGSLNNPTTDPASVAVTPLVNGASITADQTIAGVEGPQSAAVVVAVPAPLLIGPLTVSDTIVAVDGLHPLATDATVYVNGAAAGTAATGGAATVNVTLNSSLFINDEVTATQTIDGIEGPPSNTISVEVPMCTRVFFDDFDTDTSANWNVIVVDNGGENDALATFAFDYGAVGIPPSPNGSGSTLGLKLEANPGGAGATAAVTVSPIGQSFLAADGYRMTFDMWINANGPFPAGGMGSTQFLAAGAGYDDATGNLGNTSGSGAWYAISGESGSSRDVRAYKDVEEQFPESGQYAAGMQNGVANNTNNDQFYFDLFGTPSPPAAQEALFPDQTGNLLTGSAGFAWHEATVTVLGTKARWEINGVTVVTIDTTIGNPFSGLDGNISLGLMDVFSSISDNPQMSFGLVDNVKIFIAGALTGDIDGDDQVGLSDLAVLLSNFGRTGDATLSDGDLDGDQDVDLADLAVMLSAFGNVCR